MESLTAFGKRTSIAGLNNAVNSTSNIRRFIWFVIFFSLLGLTIQSFVNTVLDYLDYPVLTNVNVTRRSNLPFPAITVCNVNRVHCMNLIENQLLARQRIKELPSEENNKILNILTDLVEVTGCLPQVCSSILQFLSPIRIRKQIGNNDLAILAFADLGCISKPEHKLRNCYYLKSIEEDSILLNKTDVYNRALKAQILTNCQLKHACVYTLPPDIPPHAWKHFQLPKSCGNKTFNNDLKKEPYFDKFYNTNPLMSEEAKFFNLYYELPIDIRKNIGHQFGRKKALINGYNLTYRGLMLSCSYRGESCLRESKYWISINLPNYGNCFTFNSMERLFQKLRATSLTGEANGVSMSFYIDQDNYIVSRLSEKSGLRVIIHEPGNFPLPDENGINIQPATSSSIGIQKSDILRLPHPYISKCFSNWSQTPFENLTQNYDLYSIAVCQKICLQLRLYKRCGCVLPYITELTGSKDKRICNIKPDKDKESDYHCSTRFLESFNSNVQKCGCNVACREVDYTFYSTSSSWPSDNFWEGLGTHIGLITKELLPLPSALKPEFQVRIQRDFAKTIVYYQTLSVKVTEQLPKYSDESFVSGLGGTMSLYLGIAIIMIFEILELIYDILSSVGLYILKGDIKRNTNRSIQAMK